ncbi:MAG: hypothetical protein WDO71_15965 [Bacteroidota bacterium]
MLAFLLFIVSFSIAAQAQEHKPELLKEPANWAFERFVLPPSFALGISYKGVEELRFSPGMFSKDSTDYFTYAFVAQLDDVTAISQNDINDYLLKYFKGLCSATARDRKLIIDTTRITAATERKKGTAANEIIYNASVNVFGVFVDGAPVKVNIEVKALTGTGAKKTYLIFIVSPREENGCCLEKTVCNSKGVCDT